MPNPQIACSVCYWRLVFVEITIKPQIFHASVGRIQLSRFCFSARNFQRFIFKLFNFRFKILQKKFKFLLADSDFHVSAFQFPIFQVSVGKFQLSRFCFSGFNFSSFCWQVPIFTLLLLNFLRNQCLFSNCFYLRNFGTSLQ
jgi:hypothetical protein